MPTLAASFKQAYDRVFGRFWNATSVLVMAGVFAAFYFGLTGTLWAVTGEFTRWGGNALQLFGVDPSHWAYFQAIKLKGGPLDRTDGWLVLGMLWGSLCAALLSGNFKIRTPRQYRRWLWAFVGGLLAGFGTRLAMGCNLAAFFTGLPQFSLHAWLFIGGTTLGTYIGVKLAVLPLFKGKPKLEFGVRPVAKRGPDRGTARWHLYAGAASVVLLLVCIGWNVFDHRALMGLAALFGAAFGVLIQRGQICFTSGLRDLWLFGKGKMAKAILAGMAVQTVGTAVFIDKGVPPVIHWASVGSAIGGVMFGIGIVIAGGCETGWMYRLMEGQLQFAAVGAGNIVGATVLAYSWDHWGVYRTLVGGAPEVNLLHVLGWTGGIVATFAFLAMLYALVVWREHTFHRRLAQRRVAVADEITA
ncbi:MAG: selenium metabolism membrane protein YedE/FdhT [Alicyclobacillus macrosporangiidus]|uniref:selenium metabolism membrane protein YedE/FdhT n=1 Tax=Alicyclobacillus macrosporangiidus TaxID=392015 RepID=UPI0026ED2BA8|nr:selenium metabolism membrane protein YedE/FdhT [Alicyclobacillus macrosporangiidus]MCL6598508.1 selenium metabolism membrane protein YedE/FdhT [Alicyclobacillus macrosporangiidus]